MKKTYFLLIAAAVAFGCGKKDKFMYSQVATTPVLNPDLKSILKDNTILNANLDSSGVIRGVTDKNAFNTSDQFQTFNHAGYSISNALTPYVYDKNTVIVATGTILSPMVHYSQDYGFTWDSMAPVLSPAINTGGYYETDLSVAYINKQTFVMIYVLKSSTNIHKKMIYKVDIGSKQAQLINSWQDYYIPMSVKYTNDTIAYMLIYRSSVNGTYIAKTTNGGSLWTTPLSIDTRNMSIMQVADKGNICVYEPNSYAAYSTDSGATWRKSAYSSNFNALHMVTPSLSFALTNDGLVKSADTGKTWTAIPSTGTEFSSMKHIYFNTDQKGIMYTDQKMFITSDGGATWKTLLYPYGYIIN
jgi:hypothetical protein